MPKPPQQVLVNMEAHIQITDSKVVFFSQFVSLLWTWKLLPFGSIVTNLLVILIQDIDQSETQIVIPTESHGRTLEEQHH